MGNIELEPTTAATEFNLVEYWTVITKYRKLIATIVAVCVAIGIIACVIGTPTYKATVVLNVEREKATAMDLGAAPAYVPYEPEFVPTQTRLMQSREVAERVVEHLHLTDNKDFMASGKPLKSNDVRTPADVAAVAVQESIETNPVRKTNLVELSVVAREPKLAADLANAVADAYIDFNVESKYVVVGQASRFLSAQVEQLKAEIQDKEHQLQAYGREKDIVSVDPNSNVTMQKLGTFNQDYAAAVADRVAKEARYREVQSSKPETIADNLSNGLVTQLRNDQAKLEREYAEKLNLYKPEWPAMQQLKAQIDKSKQHLASVIDETVAKARDAAYTEYMTAARREQALKEVLQGQKSEAMALNSNAVEYNNLKTEVETKRALLDTLLKRQAETEVTSRLRGERVSNVRVVDRALVPEKRYRPSYTRNTALGLLLGLALGLGFAFALEYLDRSLRSVEQVERALGLPALGIIPSVTNNDNVYSYGYGALKRRRANADSQQAAPSIELVPHSHPRSTIAEAYRAFRTALLLSRAGGLKSIVITSTSPAEGKTSTATNLGIVLGQLGKRVLIIDGDLHKPRLHQVFRVSNRNGLVTALAENLEPAAVITQTNIPNVYLVPAGPTSPNPSGLLSSPAMEHFLEAAKKTFDYVILDAPPVGAVADAIIVGYQVDGAVLCVRGGRTSRDHVARVRDRMIRANVRILGVLLNNLEESMAAGAYAGYYAAYGAGKGYTEDLPGTRAAS